MVVGGNVQSAPEAQTVRLSLISDPVMGQIFDGMSPCLVCGHAVPRRRLSFLEELRLLAFSHMSWYRLCEPLSVDALRSVEGKLDADASPEQWDRVSQRLLEPLEGSRRSALPTWASRVRHHASHGANGSPTMMVLVGNRDERVAGRHFTVLLLDAHVAASLIAERWVELVKRVDSVLLSIRQRVVMAARWIAASPDSPPGERIVSSARVPRGPDVPRVTSVLVPRGAQFTLA